MKNTEQAEKTGFFKFYDSFKHVVGLIVTWIYRLRKIILAAPVVYFGPLALTGGCLAMMFLSRKAMYAWAVSIFSLALPVLLLISNVYPA